MRWPMKTQSLEQAATSFAASAELRHAANPHDQPSFSWRNRMGRVLWSVSAALLFRPSPRPLHGWRALLLRLFGAQLGRGCHIYAGARIWAPWNLVCDDGACIADGAIVYNPMTITLGRGCVVSQQAYLCGAGHDIDDPGFPMVSRPITIGAQAWVAARATVCAGVAVGEGAVLGLGSVATRDLQPWSVYAGVPARYLRQRTQHHGA